MVYAGGIYLAHGSPGSKKGMCKTGASPTAALKRGTGNPGWIGSFQAFPRQIASQERESSPVRALPRGQRHRPGSDNRP